MNRLRFGICIVLSFIAYHAHAGLVISEIMYDVSGTDTDREWIEVQNTGTDSISLTNYKLYEANTNHSLVEYQGGVTLAPSAYAIIADSPSKFLADWPGFSGVLVDASFSLSNEQGEVLALKDSTNSVIDTVTYTPSLGAAGDGNSLQKITEGWIAATPTPGAVNSSETTYVDTATTENPQSDEKATSTPQKITASISVPTTVQALATTEFRATLLDTDGSPLVRGYFLWNFGDGATYDEIQKSETVTHQYKYPGDYTVSLAYYRSRYLAKPEITTKASVMVIPVGVVITEVNSEGAIALANKSKVDTDISGWELVTEKGNFIFPQNSFLPAGKRIYIPSEITHFEVGLLWVELRFPNRALVSVYGNKNTLPIISEAKIVSPLQYPEKVLNTRGVEQTPLVYANDKTMDSTITTDVVVPFGATSQTKSHRTLFAYGGLGIIVVGAASLIVYLRKKQKQDVFAPEDEFEIVE